MLASEQEVEKMLNLFGEMTKIEIDDLIHDKNWGSINFESAKSDLERLFAMCNHKHIVQHPAVPRC